MNFWIAVGLVSVFLITFWVIVLSVLWHIKKYTTKKDKSSLIIKIFLVISIILTIMAVILFIQLPLSMLPTITNPL
jgi:hypothetical protein